jgi:hypothetical protein
MSPNRASVLVAHAARVARVARAWTIPLAVTGAVALSGCAAFNRGQFVMARHVTVGQEMIDLKQARDEGAITEEEYQTIKGKVMAMVDQIDVGDVFDEITFDGDDDD